MSCEELWSLLTSHFAFCLFKFDPCGAARCRLLLVAVHHPKIFNCSVLKIFPHHQYQFTIRHTVVKPLSSRRHLPDHSPTSASAEHTVSCQLQQPTRLHTQPPQKSLPMAPAGCPCVDQASVAFAKLVLCLPATAPLHGCWRGRAADLSRSVARAAGSSLALAPSSIRSC